MKKLLAGLAIASMTFTTAAFAGEYPERPVMMMVSYGAGGATDFQARIVTMTAGNEDALGMPIAIINKPGAGGRVGWNWLATEADADGYTLGAYNIPHFIAQSIKGGVEYSKESFEPIANWGSDPAVFVVGKDSAFNSMADVVAYAKENPGRLCWPVRWPPHRSAANREGSRRQDGLYPQQGRWRRSHEGCDCRRGSGRCEQPV
jgi:tripartite-type tricarboxylate transporter receptor subunit TctC